MLDCTVTRVEGQDRAVYAIDGRFDRAAAWSLRDRIERDPLREVIVDFTPVRDFSDLAVAVLAHGLTTTTRRVLLRGLRPNQLRIFRACGVAVDELLLADGPGPRSGVTPRDDPHP
jgi:anti-anti-sigma regulatory factor